MIVEVSHLNKIEVKRKKEDKYQTNEHCFFVVDDWQEEEDKDDLDSNVSVISLRIIWVCVTSCLFSCSLFLHYRFH